MKNTVIAAVIVAASAIGAAPPAQATPSGTATFLRHIHALGIPASSDSVSVEAGRRVCAAVAGGSSVRSVQAEAEAEMAPGGYTVSDADQFVVYALADLCPNAGQ